MTLFRTLSPKVAVTSQSAVANGKHAPLRRPESSFEIANQIAYAVARTVSRDQICGYVCGQDPGMHRQVDAGSLRQRRISKRAPDRLNRHPVIGLVQQGQRAVSGVAPNLGGDRITRRRNTQRGAVPVRQLRSAYHLIRAKIVQAQFHCELAVGAALNPRIGDIGVRPNCFYGQEDQKGRTERPSDKA